MNDDNDEEDNQPLIDEEVDYLAENTSESLYKGAALIREKARIAPKGPGVYRMLSSTGEVLYVGKAKHIQRRILSYTRPKGLVSRIVRMVSITENMEFISTNTETEALLLEANLIKQLKPRFNVLLRDDKSFPYILITGNHESPMLTKHRGAKGKGGDYFGPFASTWAVNRSMHALQRAFMLRSCADSEFANRSRPCLLHQIKRCAGPCTGEISKDHYDGLVREAKSFLSGKSHAIKETLANKMEEAAQNLEFETAAVLRDRLSALAGVQASQGINPRSIEEADVFTVYQEAGHTCIQVFFFRTGQNWGNRAYFPRADKSLLEGEILSPFMAQFYADKPAPSLILTSHETGDDALLMEAFTQKMERKVTIATPKRGEKLEVIEQALNNAKEALQRKLQETATQKTLLQALANSFALPKIPFRIEILDNSHIQGAFAIGAIVTAGVEGFMKNAYRKYNMKAEDYTAGDDTAMMQEVLSRRFKRDATDEMAVYPDLIVIDGGLPQMNAAFETMQKLEIAHIPLICVAKGRDREAGRELFHMPNRPPVRLEPRDPVLFFLERLRDEAHRFAIGAHRVKRAKGLREGGLEEIAGIGKTRKRALMRHFGTLKAVERASLTDLQTTPGIDDKIAQAIYNYFHDNRP